MKWQLISCKRVQLPAHLSETAVKSQPPNRQMVLPLTIWETGPKESVFYFTDRLVKKFCQRTLRFFTTNVVPAKPALASSSTNQIAILLLSPVRGGVVLLEESGLDLAVSSGFSSGLVLGVSSGSVVGSSVEGSEGSSPVAAMIVSDSGISCVKAASL